MPHVVKLSSELVAAAREAARLAHRSTAAQIEHWAALGRSMEDHLTLRESNTLKLSVQEPVAAYATDPEVQRIGQRLASALAHSLTATGQAEARATLDTLGWPQYGARYYYPCLAALAGFAAGSIAWGFRYRPRVVVGMVLVAVAIQIPQHLHELKETNARFEWIARIRHRIDMLCVVY